MRFIKILDITNVSNEGVRHILHADFDAFFASVEQLDNPNLRDQPVVVGGSPQLRGVVASASYEARQFGVRSAMPMRTALHLCPDVIRVTARFSRYQELSEQVMSLFSELTPLVEPVSLDEAFLDVTASVTKSQTSATLARYLKQKVKAELGLTISVGVATSKAIAKIASQMGKPDGLTIISPGSERDFLAPLKVSQLWGIGPKTTALLHAEEIHTIGDLASHPEEWFTVRFGKRGSQMRAVTLGQDKSPLVNTRETKSVSAEATFSHDSGDPEILQEMVSRLSQNVARHLRRKGLRGRTVKLKLRLADFTTLTRQKTLPEFVQSSEDIVRPATEMLSKMLVHRRVFRLVGIGVSGFALQSKANDQFHSFQPKLSGFK